MYRRALRKLSDFLERRASIILPIVDEAFADYPAYLDQIMAQMEAEEAEHPVQEIGTEDLIEIDAEAADGFTNEPSDILLDDNRTNVNIGGALNENGTLDGDRNESTANNWDQGGGFSSDTGNAMSSINNMNTNDNANGNTDYGGNGNYGNNSNFSAGYNSTDYGDYDIGDDDSLGI